MSQLTSKSKSKKYYKYTHFFWPILQLIVFIYFSDVFFEKIEIGDFSPFYLLSLFSSYIFLLIGIFFEYKNSNKSKPVLLISFALAIISLYYWLGFISIASCLPVFPATINVFFKKENKEYASLGTNIFWGFILVTTIAFACFDQYKAMESVRKTLVDPNSASFRNVRVLEGYSSHLVCGEVNAKNSLGGYIGFKKFIVLSNKVSIFDDDDYIEIDFNRNPTQACEKLVKTIHSELETFKINIPESPSITSENNQSQTDLNGDPANKESNTDLSKYLFKPSIELVKDTSIEPRFKALLGDQYGIFYEALSVSSELEFNSHFYLGGGCAVASCDSAEAAFVIDLDTGQIFASIISEGNNIRSFGATPGQKLPSFLNDWAKAHSVPK